MQSKSIWCGALLVVMALSAHGQQSQTVTIRDVLSQPVQNKQVSQPREQDRVTASITLDAIYGQSSDLRVDMHLNDKVFRALSPGAILKSETASCKVIALDMHSRCVNLGQEKKAGDICPKTACWTGKPYQSSLSASNTKAPLLPLPYPPTPVPGALATSTQGVR
ncbi:hypothetical protein [Limnohabitans sp. DM1]|uniref:hypothetical protein n=1 Tax=Limnohabitans sp. DM1 TaxID=1597955 RepID=UPI000B053B98|nr:hypothetical protein [Limnohabitans sp. DM1]